MLLRKGDKGSAVKELQELLNTHGDHISTDGIFGPGTEKALKEFQASKGLAADGVAGPKTMKALKEKDSAKPAATTATSRPATRPASSGSSNYANQNTWDSHSDKRIATLHPKVIPFAKEFIIRLDKELGKTCRVTSGYRSIEEQNELYAQGRTTEGKVVTNAKGGQSYHNFGVAIDIVEIKGGKALWSNPDQQAIADLGKSIGFEWGGDWKSFKDKPHFQMTFGYSTSQMFAKVQNGDTSGPYPNV